MGYIEGQDRNQIILFPESLDEYISSDNMVRVVDVFVDNIDLASLGFTKATPSQMGRPPFSANTLAKLYIYGYYNNIRSSRKLKREAHRNVEVMWLLKKLTPDHRVIATFRKENAAALKELFKAFVKMCNEFGLYGKELVGIDGSKFEAVNSNDKNFNIKRLKDRISRLDAKIEEYIKSLEEADSSDDNDSSNESMGKTLEILEALKQRRATYEKYSQDLLATGDSQISTTDPDSRRMRSNGRSDMSYNVQHSVDIDPPIKA